jgi:hypothetical protein
MPNKMAFYFGTIVFKYLSSLTKLDISRLKMRDGEWHKKLETSPKNLLITNLLQSLLGFYTFINHFFMLPYEHTLVI